MEKSNRIYKTKNSGILGCGEIISEILKQDEFGCAFEHLTYVISETETNLTTEQSNRIEHPPSSRAVFSLN